MEILRASHLCKTYGKGENEVRALDDVSFSIEKGEFVAIVGTSGSGKSTLMHILGGVDRPDSGSVYMDGQARLAIILKIIVYALMLLAPRWIKNQNRGTRQSVVELSLYRMALINIVILDAANQATILTRFSGVFSLYAIADFSEQVARLQYKKNREIVTILALVLFAVYGGVITLYRTPEWQTTYPFVWWR